ncbi:hypothetical protein [Aggregatilinea lenta]|uniref:hypothetical protein n=1 Tax=Aggregatilinea lenta TaxID=913108 RepID=UPI000E5BC1E9|nr:hypothetical protein [Aggregatilinea lenta]
MPIELMWLIPDQILLSRWTDDVGPADMQVLVEELGIILDAADRAVHSLLDLTEVRTIQPAVLPTYLQSPIPTHPHRGRLAIASTRDDIATLIEELNRRAGSEAAREFATRAEAREYLLSFEEPPAPEGDAPGADG